MSMSDCPHCGYSNPLEAQFCGHCGTNLARIPPPRPSGDSSEKPSAIAEGQEEETTDRYVAPGPVEPAFSRTWFPPAAEEDSPDQNASAAESQSDASVQPEPLLGGLPGLLEPADPRAFAASESKPSDPQDGAARLLPHELAVNEEERRRLRDFFSEELPAADGYADRPQRADQVASPRRGLRRQRRIEWLLFLGLTAALLGGGQSPAGRTGIHSLPGLLPVYQQIETLPPHSLVLINWAYDPATSGEMDFVALPVIEHLLNKQAKLIVVSQLPAGPATARRLIAKAEESLRRPSRSQAAAYEIIEGGFLPGGVASLPLLAVAPAQTLPVDPRQVDIEQRFTIASMAKTGPVLELLIAARSEDVRRWLEQVQPLNDGTVIAVTSAAADPALRPFLNSGQLAGLVSGWDGGRAYQRRIGRARSLAEQARSLRQIDGQSWGFSIFIIVIVLGNLAGLMERRVS